MRRNEQNPSESAGPRLQITNLNSIQVTAPSAQVAQYAWESMMRLEMHFVFQYRPGYRNHDGKPTFEFCVLYEPPAAEGDEEALRDKIMRLFR